MRRIIRFNILFKSVNRLFIGVYRLFIGTCGARIVVVGCGGDKESGEAAVVHGVVHAAEVHMDLQGEGGEEGGEEGRGGE